MLVYVPHLGDRTAQSHTLQATMKTRRLAPMSFWYTGPSSRQWQLKWAWCPSQTGAGTQS